LGIPAFQSALDQSSQGSQTYPFSFAASLPIARRFEVSWEKWRRMLGGFFSRVLQAFTHWLRRPRALIEALAFTWVHMLCVYLSIEVLLVGMGEPVPLHLIAGLWSAVYFITLLPVSINGYGLQEVSLAFIFTRLGGLSTATALTLAILVRTITMLASLPGALFVPGIMAARSETSGVPGNQTDFTSTDQNLVISGNNSEHISPPVDE
jgi:uncharacterized membrane protein YbhN (UPF0104 family)